MKQPSAARSVDSEVRSVLARAGLLVLTIAALFTDDVTAALARGRHCLVLTQWTEHLDRLVAALSERAQEPLVLRGGMGVKARAAALARLEPQPDGPPLLGSARNGRP